MLRPTEWNLRKEVTPLLSQEEIAKRIDDRPLLHLRGQIDDAIRQIVIRAAAGDDNAIHALVAVARGVIPVLETVEKAQPKKLQATAEGSVSWPVLLSRTRPDIERATNHVRRLKVGERAPTPRKPGQRLDPRGFWTQLAATAFDACQANKVVVPVLKAHCTRIGPRRESHKFWGITMQASFYYVSSTDCILITDWEERCVNLPLPVTSDNLKQWWYVVKRYVLEYWHLFPQEYEEALRRVGHADDEVWRRRNRAVDRLGQAFRDLVELR